MRDIPMFTTEYGVASLMLREIPYRQEAYICVQATCQPKELLEECVGFCRACGAEKIYASNHDFLETYPLYTTILKMCGTATVDDSKVNNLWPVTEETVESWRAFMNERLKNVDNAATLDRKDETQILSSGGAYFVHKDKQLLGGGWLKDGELKLIAAIPGAGEQVMHTLMSLVEGTQMRLEVASTNEKAISLYKRLGFIPTAEKTKWYRVL